ncbi:Riboflavin transporter RibU [bioreactor metagenome]|uniref:Riboflavin transporter RibU n=1 Tax=bioreactor metagenome TaxID=1076179 RepID=A0A645AHR6_9ZZZZ
MKNSSTRKLAIVAVFSALAAIIYLFDFSLPFFPPFIKLDFADLPALIAAFTFGPVTGILIQVIRNALHLFVSNTGGVGELANIVIGGTMVGTAGLIYQHNKTKAGAFKALLAGTIAMTLVAMPLNYYVILPLYSLFMPIDKILALSAKFMPAIHDKFTFILYVTLPFNLLKGTVISLSSWLLYKKLQPALHHLRS